MILDMGECATGKTFDLVARSAETGYAIVCASRTIEEIERTAKRLGLKIPSPITYGDFLNGGYEGYSEKWLIDSLLSFMDFVVDGEIIDTITLSSDSVEINDRGRFINPTLEGLWS